MFDYSKLRGKIKERFNTQENFASAMGFSATTLSDKLNNKFDWTQTEIEKASELLKISKEKLSAYFFTPKVRETDIAKGETHETET